MDSHDSTEIDSSLKDQNNENAEEQVFRSQLAVSLKKSITSEKSVSFNSGCEGFTKLREKFLLLEKQHTVETDRSSELSKKTKSVDNRSLKLNFLNHCVDNNQQCNFSYEKDNLPVNNINSVVVDDEELVKSTNQTELLSIENKVLETEEKTRNVKYLTIDTDIASKEREDNCKREQVISPEEKSRKIVKTIEHLVDNVPIFKDLLREFSEEDNKKYNEVKTTSNFLEETSKDDQEIDFFDENIERYNYNKSKEKTSSLSSTSSSLDDDDNDNFIPKIVENPGSAKPLKSILKKSSQNNSPELCAKFPVPKKVLTIEDNKKDVTDDNSSVESTDIDLSIASAKLDKIVEDITDSNEPENNSAKDRLNKSQLKIEKLQQSLPTKLSTSTVESLKSKYSPTNFGYPKSFIKSDETDSSEFNSKIPLFSPNKKSSIKTTQDSSIPTIINATKITDVEVPLVTDKTDLERTACQSFKGESGKEYEVKTVIEDRLFETETNAKLNISDDNNNTSEECSKSDGLNENAILDNSIKDTKSNIEERKLSNQGSIDNETNLIDTEQSEEKTKIDEENSKNIQKNGNEEISNVKSDSAENVQSVKEDSLSSSKFLNSDNVEITNEKNKSSDSDSDYGILVSNELKQKEIADGYAELVKSLTMNENKKSSKKRTSSFRKLLPSLFGSSKDKNKTSSTEKNSKLVRDINGQKKSENSFMSENFQNEVHNFERNSVERHTFNHYPVRDDSNSRHTHVNENNSEQDFFQFPNVEVADHNGTKVVRIQNRYQRPVETDTYSIPVDTCDNFDERLCMRNNKGAVQEQDFHTDEYVCMGNGSQCTNNQQNIVKKKLQYMNIEDVSKYIDTSTSSSNSTLISEHNLSGWENPIQRRPHNARHINRNELIKSPSSTSDYSNRNRFSEKPFISTNDTQMYANNPETLNEDSLNTGPNNFDPQLIKPKAIIPITTERPLPNPYHNVRDISYETKNKTLFSPEEEKQELLHPTQNAESHYNKHDSKKDDSLIYDLLAEAISSSTPKNEMDTKEARAFPNTSKQIDRNLQKYSETTTPNKSTNSNSVHINQNEDIFYHDYTPTKSQYETVYGNIRKNTNENTSSSSDPYKHLVPVSAEVKITRHPVINTKKSLRARSLSPEQRYKLDIPKQVQRSNQLESREFYNTAQQQSLQNPNQNDYINRNNTLGELVEIRTGNTNTPSKVLNSQHMSKKSPKNERKSLKKSMSDVGKRSKVKNDTSTHQKLEIELDYPENFNQSQREKVSPQKDVYLNRKDRPVAIEHKVLMKNEIRQSDNRGPDACRLPVRKDSRPSSENRTQRVTSSPRKERQLIQNDHVVDLEIQNAELEKKYTRQLNDNTNSRDFCTKDASKMTCNFDKHNEQKVGINSSQMKQIQQEEPLRTKLKPITSGEMSKTEAQFNPRVHSPSATNVTHRNFDSPVNIDTSSPIIMSTKSSNSSPSPRQNYKNPPLSPQHLQNLRNVEMWANKQKEQPGMNCPAYKQPPSKSNSSKNGSITTKAVVHHNPNSAMTSQNMTYTNVPIQRGHVPPSGRVAQFSEARHMNSSPSLQKQQLSLQNMQYMEMSYWQMIKEKRDREEYEVRYKQQVLRQRDDMNLSAEHRSRASGGFVRNGRRSASLPRSITYTAPIGSSHHDYFARHADKIPEYPPNEKIPNTIIASHEKLNQSQISHTDYGYLRQRGQEAAPVLKTNNNNNFVRGSGQRSTIGPINTQKSAPSPIAEDIIYENFFPDVQLRYQCQPIRRDSRQMPIFKRGSLNEQSVQQDNEGLQLKKVSFSGTSNTNMPSGDVWPTKNGYVQSPPTRRNRGPSVISMGDDSVFIESENDNGNVSKHVSRCLVEPQYGKTAHKQVTVTDKVCDFYGKIHDTNERRVVTPPSNYGHIQKSGVIYGELKRKPNPIPHGYTNNPYTANDIENTKKMDNCEPIRMNNQSDTHNRRQHEHIENSRLIDTRNTQFFHSPVQQFSRKPDNSGLKYPQNRSTSAPLMQNVTNKWPDTGNRAQEAPNRPLPPIPRDNKRMDNIPRASNYVYGDGRVGVRSMSRPSNTPESESGSEAGEVQRILSNMAVLPQYQQQYNYMLSAQKEEEWNADGKSRGPPGSDSGGGGGGNADVGELRGGGPRGSRSTRREDPRRHTLSGDQHLYPPGPGQGGVLTRTMDLEGNLPRGYPPPSNAMLFDDDPGIMSEVETSSTGFRRGGKQRSSLPVVRTPSKTLERPLGLVFLQYRNETKRALLPNEITSIDTVKALFVRSFPKQLTMEYLDSPLVKIYIHDSSKDMFYELEDLRSHLRDIRDRSVLRLFESTDVTGGLPGPGTGITGGVGHFEDQSYFSEPEFDSEYQHQHIHKSKTSGKNAPPYYMGSATTLPRRGPLLRAYSPAVGAPVPADRIKSITGPTGTNSAPPKPVRAGTYPAGAGSLRGAPPGRYAPFLSPAELRHAPDSGLYSLPDRIHSDGYMSSPERGSRGQYEDPYYSQYAPRSGSMTPVIDEEASDTELLDESYSLYGVKLPPGGPRAVPAPRSQFPVPAAVPYDATRIRVEHMERQLANLTGLVQKALTQTPNERPTTRDFLQVPAGRENFRADKSVSFEKSVSFSDEPPDMNSPKQHSPQHAADTKPPKPAIKSSTLPRTSSQERDRLKPAPPPKPAALAAVQYESTRHIYRDLQLTPEMYNQLRGLQKKAKDLRAEVRNLRRMSQAQAHSVRETIRDTFIKIRSMLIVGGEQAWQAGVDQEKIRLSREEDLYKQEMLRLEKDLTDLESTVEELRGNVINRKTRVNMSDVENMALILSKSSKTVADLKVRFPGLQEGLKSMLTSEMDKVVREEKFLKEEPDRLESALRRCKKLTGTLVTLKRLASVQEQRLPCANSTTPDGRLSPTVDDTPPITPTSGQHGKPIPVPAARPIVAPGGVGGDTDSIESGQQQQQRPENALDALLDELQTFSRPTVDPVRKSSGEPHALSVATGGLRRLHSYPSGSDTDNSPPLQPAPRGAASKPPLPERSAELMHALAGRRAPPPPPPRTSSRSPLASPTSPGADVSGPRRGAPGRGSVRERAHSALDQGTEPPAPGALSASSSCESVNSQEGARRTAAGGGSRQEQLEMRHQELLRKQRALQEQYARLQQLQRGSGGALTVVPPAPDLLLKKTGSESNLLQKMGLSMSAPPFTGSLTHLAKSSDPSVCDADLSITVDEGGRNSDTVSSKSDATGASTTSKVYETDIL